MKSHRNKFTSIERSFLGKYIKTVLPHLIFMWFYATKTACSLFFRKIGKSSLPIKHGFIQGLILIQIILCNNSDKERLFFIIFWFRFNMKKKTKFVCMG